MPEEARISNHAPSGGVTNLSALKYAVAARTRKYLSQSKLDDVKSTREPRSTRTHAGNDVVASSSNVTDSHVLTADSSIQLGEVLLRITSMLAE